MTQGVQEQITILPAIKSELHLFQISREMFCADMMPGTLYGPLEQREGILDCVCMDIADHVDFGTVIDGLVLFLVESGLNHRLRIADPVIRDDSIHVHADAIFDVLCECVRFGILDVIEPYVAAALPDADYDFFVGPASSAAAPFNAADVRFVHFDRAIEHLFAGFDHGSSNTMAKVPYGFVANSDSALNLAGRHSLLRFAQQQGSHEPFRQWKVGVIEDRASRHGELVVAILTIEKFLLGFKFRSSLLAARTFDACRPAETAQQFAASFICREFGSYVW